MQIRDFTYHRFKKISILTPNPYSSSLAWFYQPVWSLLQTWSAIRVLCFTNRFSYIIRVFTLQSTEFPLSKQTIFTYSSGFEPQLLSLPFLLPSLPLSLRRQPRIFLMTLHSCLQATCWCPEGSWDVLTHTLPQTQIVIISTPNHQEFRILSALTRNS